MALEVRKDQTGQRALEALLAAGAPRAPSLGGRRASRAALSLGGHKASGAPKAASLEG